MKLLSEFCFSCYIDVGVVVLAFNILHGNVVVVNVVAVGGVVVVVAYLYILKKFTTGSVKFV